MRELKIFIIVVILTGVTYWGIEPYAHNIMHPHVGAADYDFGAEGINQAKSVVEARQKALDATKALNDEKKVAGAQKDLEEAQKSLEDYTAFWNDIKAINLAKGDATKGAETFANAGCAGCHGVEAAGMPTAMSAAELSEAYGVVPPDLSSAGAIYDEHFLAALIKDPTKALKLTHKFNDETPYPMPAFFGAGGEDPNAEIADMVAYLKSIAPKEIGDEKVFLDACQRCHDMKYENKYVLTNRVNLAAYMGSNPPDLSMMIRSKGDGYLHKFINDTQKMLPGTSMPRVGLNKASEDKVVAYMAKAGDAKKAERESLGINAMIYFLIFGIFGWLWKRKVWSDLH
nr:c-type cytochrome [uncultured Campylobacter sp.]